MTRVVLTAASLTVALSVVSAQEHTNPTAAAVAAFNKQTKAYLDVRAGVESKTGSQKMTANPQEIVASEKALADGIRAVRAAGKQGDVFVPDVVPLFKKIFADYYARRTGRERRLVFDEVPDFKPQVNMTYPVRVAKATFPPRLALALPQLPDSLEYRIVGNDLILRDGKSNLIVDFIPNVLPAPPAPGGPK